MKLSISNIAWPQEDEDWVLKMLEKNSWDAIEIAPSRVWEDFRKVPRNRLKQFREKINSYGLNICSLHSIFYGVTGVHLFGDESEKRAYIEYLKELVDLSHHLENKVIVLGSPSVRDKGKRTLSNAILEAADTLRDVSEFAKKNDIMILIEPLTRGESNFINTHTEGLSLVNSIDNTGFGLHLDAKSVAEEDDVENVILSCKNKIMHFHVNDPELAPIGSIASYHEIMANSLKESSYDRYVSIEMRQTIDYRESIKNSMEFVKKVYG